MTQTASYVLSSYSFISSYSFERLLDVGYHSKDGNPIPSFDENLLIELCTDAQDIFAKESNVLEIEGDVVIVGDIHGSLHDLLRILKFIQDSDTKVLFLGDYVDRGNFSLECITILLALKIMKPDKFFLIRGNHEFDSICSQYGFLDEIINYHNPKKVKETSISPTKEKINHSENLSFLFTDEKSQNFNNIDQQFDEFDEYYASHKNMDCYQYTENLYQAFINTFAYLPISAIINKTNFCIHGGLSPDLSTLDQIRKDIIRPIYTFEENKLLSDLVWSDPSSIFPFLFSENPRGRGCLFNQNSVFDFLNDNNLKRMIRGHECIKNGLSYYFHEKCITVFSASSYSKEIDNSSGILKLFEKDDTIEFVTFPPIHRLAKIDTVYYKVQAFHESQGKIQSYHSFRHPQLASNPAVKMVKNKMIRQIKLQQSINPKYHSKLFLISSIGRNDNLTQRTKMSHSVSMDNFNNQNNINSSSKNIVRNMNSLDSLPSLSENY